MINKWPLIFITNMKKVVLLIAHEGFQPVEYYEAKKVLDSAGFDVITASDKTGQAVPSAGTNFVDIDYKISEIKPEDYDGFFIIGGHGAMDFLNTKEVHNLFQSAEEKGKFVGAICVAPRILAEVGILKSKKATGWDGDNELGEVLANAGAEYIREPVVTDGKLITASGPSVARDWGLAIVKAFK